MEEHIVDEIMQDMENERTEAENRHTSEREGGGPDNTK